LAFEKDSATSLATLQIIIFLDLMNVGCASYLHLEDEFTDPEKLRVKGRISSE
jgi:hypothetical protein